MCQNYLKNDSIAVLEMLKSGNWSVNWQLDFFPVKSLSIVESNTWKSVISFLIIFNFSAILFRWKALGICVEGL